MSWNEQALSVLNERYCWKDEKTPEEVFRRVANAVAYAEHNYCKHKGTGQDGGCTHLSYWANKFYDLMINQYFMPNSPTIMNAGTGNGQNLSACFTGDTLVWTIYGARRFDQLVGKNIPVLTEKSDGTLVFRRMYNIRKTKENATVYEVTIRRRYGMRGTKTRLGIFTATPDHMIRMKNGDWKRVDELEEGDSIQSVYRSEANSKGYLKLTNGIDTDMEHRIIASYPGDKRPEYPEEHVHHRDEDKQNNKPNNIVPLSQTLHDKFSNSIANKAKEYEVVNHKIISVKPVGNEDVYCGTVEETHSFFIMPEKDGGILVHNCFVLPVSDSIEGILKALNDQVIIHKSGGGTGFSFSRLRPEGSTVNSTQGVSSGPVSFMSLFDKATDVIKQGGRRRGANMSILRIDHPDIIKFINCKLSGGITNFNISVGITDEFMQAVNDNIYYMLVDPQTGKYWNESNEDVEKRLQGAVRWNKFNGEISVCAKDVFNLICQAAWQTGDPGLFFVDRANQYPSNPCPEILQIESTNPCGEQALEPNGVCNLGSINLGKYVIRQGGWPYRDIDTELLREHVKIAIRLLDNVIDINNFPTPEIKEQTYKLRRIGLGIMGWADMLMLLGISYDSSDALDIAEHIMSMVKEEAENATHALAQLKGEFPLFNQSIYKGGQLRRNSNLTTIAPTGTISFFANCLDGQTQIHTLDGNFPIKDLVGTEQLVYCLDATGNIKLRKAFDIRKTGNNMPVYKVLFDTGEYIIGTQEHPILLTSGKYVSIKDLQFNDSVMAVEKRLTGHKFPSFKIRSSVTKWKTQYIIAAEDKFGRMVNKGEHVHHIDGNHLNDHPDNLDIIPAWKHSAIHSGLSDWNENKRGKTLEEIYGEEKALEIKIKMGVSRIGEKNGRYGHVMTEEEKLKISIATKEAMQRPEVKERQRLGTERRSSNQVWKQKMLEHNQNMVGTLAWNSGKTKEDDPRIAKYGSTRSENSKNRKNISNNHRVLSVEFYGYEDVYNMEVEEFHNFVANGVVVHNCSSGVEPIFSLDYTHIAGNGVERRMLNSTFQEIIANLGINKDLPMNQIMEQIPNPYKNVFVNAHQITPYWHIQHQATFQKYVDNSISKTINMPNSATVEEVAKAYQMAYDAGCMGVTVYRNGCKPTQVLNDNTNYGEIEHNMDNNSNMPNGAVKTMKAFVQGIMQTQQTVLTRPNKTHGATYSKQTSSGKVHITINGFNGDNDPREMFVSAGKAGSDRQADCEAIGRLVSLYLRTEHASPVEKLALIAEQLSGIGGSTSYGFGKDKVKSIPDAIAAIIYEHLNSNGTESNNNGHSGDMCPDCGNFTLAYQEGCKKCGACGYSEC